MNQSRFLQLGWVLFATVTGISLAGGFQDKADKIGVVDITKVVEQSSFGKENQESFAKMKKSREDLLEFIDTYRVLTNEQAQKLKDLSLKATRTGPEDAELTSLKADVVARYQKMNQLSTKTSLTTEERALVEEYARQSQTMNDVAQRWFREFTADMGDWADKQKMESISRARTAIQEVAKQQGYTVVFELGVAPYGANDMSDAALQAMNAKK
ncbi:MAG: OmpH family outer membrane protein [Fimbriimonas sp.]